MTAISNGRTLGKALVNIQIVSSENKGKAGILRLAARYIILYVVGMPSVAYAYYIYRYIQTAGLYKGEWKYYAFVVCMAICVMIAVYMAIDLLLCLLSATRNMLYDRITKLTHISLAGRDYIACDDAPDVNMVDKNAAIRAKNTEDEIDNSVLNRADDNNMDKKNNNKTVNEQNNADIGRKTESINKNNIKDTKASDTVKWRNTASDSTEEYIDEVLEHFEAGDILLLQNEVNKLDYIIDRAYDRKLVIALNPSPYNEKIEACDLSKISIFLLNEIEGAQITGLTEPNDILASMRKRFPEAKIVLTLGKDGARYSDKDCEYEQPIFPVKAVDTTAAGDTFTGYFLAGLIRGMEIPDILRMSAKASSIAVT